MYFVDARQWIEGFDHNVSWTRGISVDTMLIIGVAISGKVNLMGGTCIVNTPMPKSVRIQDRW